MKQHFYRADYISGMSACIFGVSVGPEAVVWNNRHNKFHFPFHGLNISAKLRHADEWIDRKEYAQVAGRVMRSLNSGGLSYFSSIARLMRHRTDALLQNADLLLPTLRLLDDRRLVIRYEKFMDRYLSVYGLGGATFLYEETISELLAEALRKKKLDVGLALSLLLRNRYKSYMTGSSLLLHAINKETKIGRKNKLIARYLKQYFYIDAGYDNAPKMSRAKILQRARHKPVKKQNLSHVGSIKLSKKIRALVRLLRYTEIIRDQRKRACQIGLYVMFRFLEEAVRRTKIPLHYAKRSFWHEYRSLFGDTKRMKKLLTQRTAATTVYIHNKPLYLNGLLIRPKTRTKTSSIITGTPASSGSVKGAVSIVYGKNDFKKFKPGSVLVTQMTRPDFLPIMERAAAIVTDEGGLTCHAAIVSRELGIPCIVGTKIATRAFKDGDQVEVDADRGIVRRLR